MQTRSELREMLERMADKWPSEVVPRRKIEEFTGGMITASNIRWLDCKGKGIKDKFYMNNRVMYPINAVIDFIMERSTMVLNEEKPKAQE